MCFTVRMGKGEEIVTCLPCPIELKIGESLFVFDWNLSREESRKIREKDSHQEWIKATLVGQALAYRQVETFCNRYRVALILCYFAARLWNRQSFCSTLSNSLSICPSVFCIGKQLLGLQATMRQVCSLFLEPFSTAFSSVKMNGLWPGQQLSTAHRYYWME